MTDRPTTLVLDVNETLFSLAPVGAALARLGLTGSLELWFARVLRDGFAVTAADAGLATFPSLGEHHLRALALERGVELPDGAFGELVAAFDLVPAQPDVVEGLRALAAAGHRLVPFTNGSAPIVARFLDRTGLSDVVETPLDVTQAGVWKPDAGAYRWVCDHLGVEVQDALMVAVHPWDVAGAMAAGLEGAWIDRDGAPWPAWYPAPTLRATSVVELAAQLGG